jgi:hypothetical protein
MNSTVDLSEAGTLAAPAHDLRAQLAEYVAQQPASKQSFHKWMQIAEWVSLALPVAVFAIAFYLSFAWQNVEVKMIPIAWFCFPLSFTPFLILVGLHSIGLGAWPPTGLFGKTMRIYFPMTGQDRTVSLRMMGKAVAWGWGTIVVALALAAFWAAFAWAVWASNLALLKPLLKILGIALGVMIVGRILLSIYQNITRSR